jgi:hypothetical protein
VNRLELVSQWVFNLDNRIAADQEDLRGMDIEIRDLTDKRKRLDVDLALMRRRSKELHDELAVLRERGEK